MVTYDRFPSLLVLIGHIFDFVFLTIITDATSDKFVFCGMIISDATFYFFLHIEPSVYLAFFSSCEVTRHLQPIPRPCPSGVTLHLFFKQKPQPENAGVPLCFTTQNRVEMSCHGLPASSFSQCASLVKGK